MNEICILMSLTTAPPLVDSKILFSLIFSLNVHVSIFLFYYHGPRMQYLAQVSQPPGAPFLPKMSYFQSRGHNFDYKCPISNRGGQDFDQLCPIYNPGGTILTKNGILLTPVV